MWGGGEVCSVEREIDYLHSTDGIRDKAHHGAQLLGNRAAMRILIEDVIEDQR
jgi:hypothetical protein